MSSLFFYPRIFESLDWLRCAMTTRHATRPGEPRLDLAARLPVMARLGPVRVVVGEQVHGCNVACVVGNDVLDPAREGARARMAEQTPTGDAENPRPARGQEHRSRTDVPHRPRRNAAPATVSEVPEADALFTRDAGVVLGVYTADCLPVVLVDPRARCVAVVHAGREGTRLEIAPKTIGLLEECGWAKPERLLVWIGPGICRDHYEVGEEIAEQFRRRFPSFPGIADDRRLSLTEINRRQLADRGVAPENIEVDRRCTFEHPDLFYSYRREGANTGRMVTFVGIL